VPNRFAECGDHEDALAVVRAAHLVEESAVRSTTCR
jgi:hypothetical protein